MSKTVSTHTRRYQICQTEHKSTKPKPKHSNSRWIDPTGSNVYQRWQCFGLIQKYLRLFNMFDIFPLLDNWGLDITAVFHIQKGIRVSSPSQLSLADTKQVKEYIGQSIIHGERTMKSRTHVFVDCWQLHTIRALNTANLSTLSKGQNRVYPFPN